MTDTDIRKCDGPKCDYGAERDKPAMMSDVSYFDFTVLQIANGGEFHFHTFDCLYEFVAKKMGVATSANVR